MLRLVSRSAARFVIDYGRDVLLVKHEFMYDEDHFPPRLNPRFLASGDVIAEILAGGAVAPKAIPYCFSVLTKPGMDQRSEAWEFAESIWAICGVTEERRQRILDHGSVAALMEFAELIPQDRFLPLIPVLKTIQSIALGTTAQVQALINAGLAHFLNHLHERHDDNSKRNSDYLEFRRCACFITGWVAKHESHVDWLLHQGLLRRMIESFHPWEKNVLETVTSMAKHASWPQMQSFIHQGALRYLCDHLRDVEEENVSIALHGIEAVICCREAESNVRNLESASVNSSWNPFAKILICECVAIHPSAEHWSTRHRRETSPSCAWPSSSRGL